jgi:benzoyl-CoA 2,3-dioxygenase component A
MSLIRQHLIDPEVCIRCNTCEETCPVDAITHNEDNYVVDVEQCKFCRDCISPCPTGAIDNWRTVETPYDLAAQFSWDELPEQVDYAEEADDLPDAREADASEVLQTAHAGEGGKVLPPFSAAHPYVNVYTRDNPITARVAGNYRLTAEDAESDIHHIVLDFGPTPFPVLEGQSIGIIPPGVDDKGKPHYVRLYSVASPRDGERPGYNNLALTVKRTRHEAGDSVVQGLASNFICDRAKGDEVQVTGPFGSSFLMPNHPDANIIMICTGTGAAPFRAMTERRRRAQPDAPGKLLLFFGARTPEELPYFGPLTRLPKELIDAELVFSRLAEQPKEYVQDRMRKRGDDLDELLRSAMTHVYICGLKGMEQGVEEAFRDICKEHGLDWAEQSAEMRRTGRYHVETY